MLPGPQWTILQRVSILKRAKELLDREPLNHEPKSLSSALFGESVPSGVVLHIDEG